jgi:hypothetical protein
MRPTRKMILGIMPIVFAIVVSLATPAVSSAHPAYPAHATRPAQVAVGISVGIAPPPLPYYDQPYCPGPNYIWTPGYWAWDGSDYYWVPGTWVEAPFVGGYWTPGYWGWGGSAFLWHEGYWGPEVGFYGGIDYGFGYGGVGYLGGEWRGGAFAYNTSVSRVNITVIHNTYSRSVPNARPGGAAYNGGKGGIQREPTASERAAEGERKSGPTSDQTQHYEAAKANPAEHYSTNHGRPAVAATAKPGDFSHPTPSGHASYRPPAGNTSHAEGGANTGHPENTPTHTNSTPHPAATPHNTAPSHTNSTPHPAATPHNTAPSHTNSTPHPAATPHNNAPSHTNSTPHPAAAPHNTAPSHAAPAPEHSAPAPHPSGGGEPHGDNKPGH